MMDYWLIDDINCSAHGCYMNQLGEISAIPNGEGEVMTDVDKQRLGKLVKAVAGWERKTSDPKLFSNMADVATALGEASAFLVVALGMLGVKDNG